MMANYEFTKSTIQANNSQSGAENIGKQLIYTPLHQAKGSISLRYKNTSLSYFHRFTGKRFTTTDNGQSIAPYDLGDLSISQYFHIKKVLLEINFSINNIWDKNYTVLPARPMSMRNYSINIKGNF